MWPVGAKKSNREVESGSRIGRSNQGYARPDELCGELRQTGESYLRTPRSARRRSKRVSTPWDPGVPAGT